MSKKVFNMQGGKHSAAAYTELEKWAYGSVVASLTSFVVSAGTGMNLNISTGAGLISDTIARRIATDATETAAVPTASASFNRIDTVVAYIDTAVTPTTSVTDNTNDILKFKVVAGTAAASPAAPTGAAIISSIGAGKPYIVLYDVLVPQNATNTSGMTLTDRRVVMTSIGTANLGDGIVTTAKIANNAVDNSKLALGVVVNTAIATFSNYVSGTTIIPFDDTIPQQSEGVEGMTITYTPKSATNILVVEVEMMVGTTGNGQRIGTLFRDATADAAAAKSTYVGNWADPVVITLRQSFVAGSTAATTFKARFGCEIAGTFYMNGGAGGRRFGTAAKSSIKVTEYKAA